MLNSMLSEHHHYKIVELSMTAKIVTDEMKVINIFVCACENNIKPVIKTGKIFSCRSMIGNAM